MGSFGYRKATGRSRHVYHLNTWIRVTATVFLAFSLLGLFGLLWSQHEGLQNRNAAEMVEWAAVAIFAASWTIYVFAAVIVLSDEGIEKRTPLKTNRLRSLEIRGRREEVRRNFDGSYIRYLLVIPRDPLLPVIRFQKFYAFDAAFYAWYDDLPNLDDSDRLRAAGR